MRIRCGFDVVRNADGGKVLLSSTDACRAVSGADIAFVNGGGIRANLDAG